MIIEKIQIENFRGLGNIEISADEHINLIIGINGAGKTSVLDAIAHIFSWFLARLRNPKSTGTIIPYNDIRLGTKEGCRISVSIKDAGVWTLFRNPAYAKNHNRTDKSDLQDLMLYIEQLKENVEKGGNIPVFMYYPVDRAINNVSAHLEQKNTQYEIWDTYVNALKGNSDFRPFFEWYRIQEDSENEHIRDDNHYRDKNLEVIRNAVSRFFPEFSELRVRRNPQRFVIRKNEQQIEFNQLSQGEKCYLTLVCDLARRFALANPHSDDPLKGSGIVLIDEIDLHLHPQWQREIIGKLKTIFPNCQFFMSTHSPQVLSDLNLNQLITLDDGQLSYRSFNPYGRLINDILSNYFNIPMPRNKEIENKIEEAYKNLQEGKRKEYEKIEAELESIIGKTDPDMVNLKIESYRQDRKKEN